MHVQLQYALNASNPGQFFYNLIYEAEPGSEATVSIGIPYPFVTQGGRPVHVYDATDVWGDDGCFVPPPDALASHDIDIGIDDYALGAADPRVSCDTVLGPNGTGSCSFDVDFVLPASGAVYINVHLDYGLKGRDIDANPYDGTSDRYVRGGYFPECGTYDAHSVGSDDLAVPTCQAYSFWHTDGTWLDEWSDQVRSINLFQSRWNQPKMGQPLSW